MAIGNLITRGGPAVAAEAAPKFIVTHGMSPSPPPPPPPPGSFIAQPSISVEIGKTTGGPAGPWIGRISL